MSPPQDRLLINRYDFDTTNLAQQLKYNNLTGFLSLKNQTIALLPKNLIASTPKNSSPFPGNIFPDSLFEGGDTTDDNILGDPTNNYLRGNGGNDTLDGGGGSDTLDGGTGNDSLKADGNDSLLGGEGNDTLYVLFGIGNNTLLGGEGDDSLTGGTGNDSLTATTGTSSEENNILDGGSGQDTVIGSNGSDTLTGGDGNDTLSGGGGDDSLLGTKGNDNLVGDDGNDTLIGYGNIEGELDILDGTGSEDDEDIYALDYEIPGFGQIAFNNHNTSDPLDPAKGINFDKLSKALIKNMKKKDKVRVKKGKYLFKTSGKDRQLYRILGTTNPSKGPLGNQGMSTKNNPQEVLLAIFTNNNFVDETYLTFT